MFRPNSRSGGKFAKVNVVFRNGCFVCGGHFSKPAALIRHLNITHGFIMDPRAPNYRRPKQRDYEYVTEDMEFDEEHFACPSCWFHCPTDNFREFEDHAFEAHNPIRVDPDYDPIEDEPLGLYNRRRSGSIGGSRPSSRQGYDRPSSRQSYNRPSSRQGQYNRPSSRQGYNRPSSRQDTKRPSSRQGYISEDTKRPSSRQDTSREETSRPSSRQSDRSRSSSPPVIRNSEGRDIAQRFEEITDLFKRLFH